MKRALFDDLKVCSSLTDPYPHYYTYFYLFTYYLFSIIKWGKTGRKIGAEVALVMIRGSNRERGKGGISVLPSRGIKASIRSTDSIIKVSTDKRKSNNNRRL